MPEEKKEIAIKENNLPVAASPAEMMQLAIEKNLDLDKIERMIELQARWDKIEAEKAYTLAMAEFKKNPPQILKDRHVKYKTKAGHLVEYDHATLGNITNTISEALSDHGFSAEFETEQGEGKARVTCELTHKRGHSKKTTLEAAHDDSGGKNQIQAVGSTMSYLMRYTLLARLGLATHAQDDDGMNSEPIEYINDKQKSSIIDMLSATGSGTISFLTLVGVKAIDEIPQNRYNELMSVLKRKLEKVKKGR